MWIRQPFFKYSTGTIMVLLILLLLYYNLPIFQFIIHFIGAVSLPILFSVLIYYILRPIVGKLENWMPKYLSILLVYLLLALIIVFFVAYLAPELIDAMGSITSKGLNSLKNHVNKFLIYLNEHFPFINLTYFQKLFDINLEKINEIAYPLLLDILATTTALSIAIAITPFILYYFLRDDNLFSEYILRFTPITHQDELKKILHDIDTTLQNFITTQMTVAVIIGSILLIGYLIIGLPYPLLLALFAMIFYVIPFLGTFIAIVPALLIAGTIHFSMIIKVIVIMFIAHFF